MPLTAALVLLEAPLLFGAKFGSLWTWPGILFVVVTALRLSRRHSISALLDLLKPRLVLAVAACFCIWWIILVAVQYYSLQFNCFDTGIFANLMAAFIRTGEYRSSILSTHGFGDHFAPMMMLAAPLLKIFPSFLLLPYLKLSAFVICTWLLYSLAREVIADKRLQLLAPLLWTIHVYANRTLEFEFQPSSLALPVVLAAFLAAQRGQFTLTLVWLITALGFKEHLALVWISVGLFLYIERGWKRRGLLLAAAGIAAGLIIYKIVIPHFAAGIVLPQHSRFGPFALIPAKIILVCQALLSVGFLPLFAPRSMLWILPAFGISLVSNDPNMVTYSFHYQDLPLAVLFTGVIYGAAALERGEGRWRSFVPASRYVPAMLFLLTLFMNTRYPMRPAIKKWPNKEHRRLVSELERYASNLNPEERTWSLDVLCPFLFRNGNVKVVMNGNEPFHEKLPHNLVTAPGVDRWPLTPEQFVALNQRLKESERQGRLQCDKDYLVLKACRASRE